MKGFVIKDTLCVSRFTRPSATWSFLTHGELLPGRGLQPGQGAGRVWAERRWAPLFKRMWKGHGARQWVIVSERRCNCGIEVSEELWSGCPYVTRSKPSVCQTEPTPDQFLQPLQVSIESVQRGNGANWIINFPQACVKLCNWCKTRVFISSSHLMLTITKEMVLRPFLETVLPQSLFMVIVK